MPLIHDSEMGDFQATILNAGLSVDDFEITKERDAPGITMLIGRGKVTVTYKPTGIARHYRDGIVPPPQVEFDRELKKNMFKT